LPTGIFHLEQIMFWSWEGMNSVPKKGHQGQGNNEHSDGTADDKPAVVERPSQGFAVNIPALLELGLSVSFF